MVCTNGFMLRSCTAIYPSLCSPPLPLTPFSPSAPHSPPSLPLPPYLPLSFPPLSSQGMARMCCDPRRNVRHMAISYLQRALLAHDLQRLSPNEWEACFLEVRGPTEEGGGMCKRVVGVCGRVVVYGGGVCVDGGRWWST